MTAPGDASAADASMYASGGRTRGSFTGALPGIGGAFRPGAGGTRGGPGGASGGGGAGTASSGMYSSSERRKSISHVGRMSSRAGREGSLSGPSSNAMGESASSIAITGPDAFIAYFASLPSGAPRKALLLDLLRECRPQDMAYLYQVVPRLHRDFLRLLHLHAWAPIHFEWNSKARAFKAHQSSASANSLEEQGRPADGAVVTPTQAAVNAILAYLPPKDYLAASAVPRTWHALVRTPAVWNILYARIGLASMTPHFFRPQATVRANALRLSKIESWVHGRFRYYWVGLTGSEEEAATEEAARDLLAPQAGPKDQAAAKAGHQEGASKHSTIVSDLGNGRSTSTITMPPPGVEALSMHAPDVAIVGESGHGC